MALFVTHLEDNCQCCWSEREQFLGFIDIYYYFWVALIVAKNYDIPVSVAQFLFHCGQHSQIIEATLNFVITCFRIIGLTTGTLSYHYGILKLVYGTNPAWRVRTEVVFHCDTGAGIGSPSLEIESESLISFAWSTAYACLPEAMACSALDPKTKVQYDLSRFAA